MPNYVYKCPRCDKKLEEYHSVKDRHNQLCPDCNDKMDIMIQPTTFHIFEPYWHPNLTSKPIWVESKKHLKELDKKYNMTSYY